MRVPNSTPVLDKNPAPMPEVLSDPVLGLGSEGRLLQHFQTPVLYSIDFNLQFLREFSAVKLPVTNAKKKFLKEKKLCTFQAQIYTFANPIILVL